VGTSSSLNTAEFTFFDLDQGNLLVEFINSDPGWTGPSSALNEHIYYINHQFSDGYWNLIPSGGLASDVYNVDLLANGFTSFPIEPQTRVIKRTTGGDWELNGTHINASGNYVYRDSFNSLLNSTQLGLGRSEEDNSPPAISCKDIVVYLEENGTASIAEEDILLTLSDNFIDSALITLSADITDFDCDDLGPNTVTLTADDNNGNISNCLATVTALEESDPVLLPKNITVYLDETGTASIQPEDLILTLSDNCTDSALVSTSLSKSTFSCGEGTVNVTLTVTDESLNSTIAYPSVNVVDNLDPFVPAQLSLKRGTE
jgi:hypothetical protein